LLNYFIQKKRELIRTIMNFETRGLGILLSELLKIEYYFE